MLAGAMRGGEDAWKSRGKKNKRLGVSTERASSSSNHKRKGPWGGAKWGGQKKRKNCCAGGWEENNIPWRSRGREGTGGVKVGREGGTKGSRCEQGRGGSSSGKSFWGVLENQVKKTEPDTRGEKVPI